MQRQILSKERKSGIKLFNVVKLLLGYRAFKQMQLNPIMARAKFKCEELFFY